MSSDSGPNIDPYWMDSENRADQHQDVRMLVRRDLDNNPSKNHMKNAMRVRDSNQSLQVTQKIWTIIDELEKDQEKLRVLNAKLKAENILVRDPPGQENGSDQENGTPKGVDKHQDIDGKPDKTEQTNYEAKLKTDWENLQKSIKDKRKEFIDECCRRPVGFKTQIAFLPGPVGELPLHVCFLRGQWRLGMEVALKMYPGREKISKPFTNDLLGWTSCPQVWNRISGWNDGGMYTGETALHIAIICKKARLVRELLKLGADLSARAVGAFFKGKKIAADRQGAGSKDGSHRRDETGSEERLEANEKSTCDYGEFPLSFAASVGAIDCCRMLRRRAIELAESKNDLSAFLHLQSFPEPQPEGKKKQKKELEKKMRTKLQKHESKKAHEKTHQSNRSGTSHQSQSVAGDESKNQHLFSQGERLETVNENLNFSSNQEAPKVGEKEESEEDDAMYRKQKKDACIAVMLYAQDSNGNTALHMAVRYKQVAIIDWLIETGGRELLSETNQDGLTPFTLAVALGHREIFNHILEQHIREIRWEFGQARPRPSARPDAI